MTSHKCICSRVKLAKGGKKKKKKAVEKGTNKKDRKKGKT
jgi:hypothetical protein